MEMTFYVFWIKMSIFMFAEFICKIRCSSFNRKDKEQMTKDWKSNENYCQALCPFLCLCVQKFKKMDTD